MSRLLRWHLQFLGNAYLPADLINQLTFPLMKSGFAGQHPSELLAAARGYAFVTKRMLSGKALDYST